MIVILINWLINNNQLESLRMSQNLIGAQLPRTQGELELIISRFKDNEYYKLSESKESISFLNRPDLKQTLLNQQIVELKDRLNVMQNIVVSLITDGNRMHHIYEQTIEQMRTDAEAINEELAQAKKALQQQKIESEKLVGEMEQRMDVLRRQVEVKEDEFLQIQQQYENLEEKVQKKVMIDTLEVKEIENQLLKETKDHQLIIELSQKKIQQTARSLAQAVKEIEKLQSENVSLKNENQQLLFQYQALLQRPKYNSGREAIQINDRENEKENNDCQHNYESENSHMESLHLENFKLESKISLENKLLREQFSAACVPLPLYTDSEKDMVNTSQVYLQYTSPSIQCSKAKDSQNHVINPKREANLKTSHNIEINIVGSDTRNKANTEHSINFSADNPYFAFFQLLVQCEKLNSPYFDIISHINISYLYDEMINEMIPFNKWQAEIKKVLEGKVKAKGAKRREYD